MTVSPFLTVLAFVLAGIPIVLSWAGYDASLVAFVGAAVVVAILDVAHAIRSLGRVAAATIVAATLGRKS